MKPKLPTKKCKFIVSVEFDVHEKLNTEDIKTVLDNKLRKNTKVFSDVEVLWRVK